jgi:tryptophan synthase beta chain
MAEKRIMLSYNEMPRQWYNIAADLPTPLSPPLHPGTLKPLGPEDLAPIFPMALIEQEVSTQRWIDIPEEVLDVYSIYRPTPLVRARFLEQYLGTPARLYFKDESHSPPGSHKPNTAIPQAYYNKREGVKRLCTETGAGQWGSALAFGTNRFGLKCTVYMVRVSYEQKPYRKSLMQTWGAEVFPSPTDQTNSGRSIRAKDPNSLGSLGIAISEAVEDAATHADAKYSLGSVLNHVLLHQTIVGLETHKQFEKIGEYPDIIIGCVGGGSNFGGFMMPFMRDKIVDGKDIRIIAAEPTACPTLTKGVYRYDFGDTAKMTPLLLMYTLGHTFVPAAIHAGGLRYHGDAPLLCKLFNDGLVEAVALHQNPAFEAAMIFARTEGMIPAPETAHAIRVMIDEALKCKKTGEEKVIAINYSGHGFFDLAAYDSYLAGKLPDYEYPEEKIKEAMKEIPVVNV